MVAFGSLADEKGRQCKLRKQIEKHGNVICLVLGMVAMVLTVVPNLILGENSILTYHDQLDGEMIAYILQAKHLFTGDTLPEFMGGMPKTALTLPAPICVLLFPGGHYFEALLGLQLIGRIVGFAGMYLLARELTKKELISAGAGLLYGLLPFLPVYGLAQYGLPLLVWCAIRLRKGKNLWFSYCYVALYGLASSLVLVGFGVLGMGLLWVLFELWQCRRAKCERKSVLRVFAAWFLLLAIYILENISLLGSILGLGGSVVSHKVEYALETMPFGSTFVEYLVNGGQHSEGYQSLLLWGMMLAGLFGCLISVTGAERHRKVGNVGSAGSQENGNAGSAETLRSEPVLTVDYRCLWCMLACVAWNLFLVTVSALWSTEAVVGLRGRLGGLGAFQLDRLLWLAPCFWYLAAACGMAFLVEVWRKNKGTWGGFAAAGTVLFFLIAAVTGVQILLDGDIKSNVQKLRNPDYALLSYGDYYAVGVMEQVSDFLLAQTGKSQEEYRVVSLGIDPAAALYHGFYCLDGYSNNYSLAYKHAFREVIAPELEKSEYLKAYYDQWGNRCYLFSAECPGYYTIEKNGFYFQDYDVNGEALKSMGCDYLLSAAYIQNAEEQGLLLMNETPFETEDSYYRIFVYEISD